MLWDGKPKFNYIRVPRKTTKEKRTYDAEGEDLPSVTTILSATKSEESKAKLAAWRQREGEKKADQIRDNAAARGTIMHRILEGHIKGEGHMDLSDLGQEAGTMAKNIIDAGLFRPLQEVYGVEVPLYYPGLWAGTTETHDSGARAAWRWRRSGAAVVCRSGAAATRERCCGGAARRTWAGASVVLVGLSTSRASTSRRRLS